MIIRKDNMYIRRYFNDIRNKIDFPQDNLMLISATFGCRF